MLRKRNRDIEQRVTRIREAVTDRWDRLGRKDVEALSDTLKELLALLEERTARQHKQPQVNLKPLMAAYATQREALDHATRKTAHQLGRQAGRIGERTGETFKTKPFMAALAGAALGLLVMSTIGRRYTGQN